MLVISCHSDTNFRQHTLDRLPDGRVHGHLDNFAGVYCVMNAFFSGRIKRQGVRIELTYGEEIDFAGAKEVLATLSARDTVMVVDVTGTPTTRDFCIEKCPPGAIERLLHTALAGMSYELFHDCPDPVTTEDEVDVYVKRCPQTFFLGIPVQDGDYNAGRVVCRAESLAAVTEAICRICEAVHNMGGRKSVARAGAGQM